MAAMAAKWTHCILVYIAACVLFEVDAGILYASPANISSTLTQVSAGDSLVLTAGNYTGGWSVPVEGVSVEGVGASATFVVCDGTVASIGLAISSNNLASISKMTFTKCGRAVVANGTLSLDSVVLTGNHQAIACASGNRACVFDVHNSVISKSKPFTAVTIHLFELSGVGRINATFTATTFSENIDYLGIIASVVDANAYVQVTDCVVRDNPRSTLLTSAGFANIQSGMQLTVRGTRFLGNKLNTLIGTPSTLGVSATPSHVVVDNCEFIGNSADVNGMFYFTHTNTLLITNSVLRDNGGEAASENLLRRLMIIARDSAAPDAFVVTVRNVTFENNYIQSGMTLDRYGTLLVEDCQFKNNTVENLISSLTGLESSFVMRRCNLSRTSGTQGTIISTDLQITGLVHDSTFADSSVNTLVSVSKSGILVVDNCVFRVLGIMPKALTYVNGNTAYTTIFSVAGDISNNYVASLLLRNSTITGNAGIASNATEFTGVIAKLGDSSLTTIRSSVMSGNKDRSMITAECNSCSLSVMNTTISDNYGIESGTVVRISQTATATLFGSVFTGSNTTLVGGAVNIDGSAQVTVTSCLFENNHALEGGAIYVASRAQLTVANSTFKGNLASTDLYGNRGLGGAIRGSETVRMAITRTIFVDNTAMRLGGAVSLSGRTSWSISRCLFASNQANGDYGGALHSERHTNASIDRTTFVSNTAAFGGGALFVLRRSSADPITLNDSSFLGNVAVEGAAVYSMPPMDRSVTSSSTFSGNVATFRGNVIASPPVRLGWRTVPTKTTFYSGDTTESLQIAQIDGYGNVVTNSEDNTMSVKVHITPDGAQAVGEAQLAVFDGEAQFEPFAIAGLPGTYMLIVASSRSIYNPAEFSVSVPIVILPCPTRVLIKDGFDYPVCDTGVASGRVPVDVIVGVIVPIFVVTAVVIGIWYRRSTAEILRKERTWLIDVQDLNVAEIIGQGAFGKVYKGTYRGGIVAVKTILVQYSGSASVAAGLVSRMRILSRAANRRGSLFASSEAISNVPPVQATSSGAVQKSLYRTLSGASEGSAQKISRTISKGKMSATQTRTLKKEQIKAHQEAVDSFLQEVQTMCSLRHPNIVLFMGACIKDPDLCIVTEFMSNGSLVDLYDRPAVKFDWKLRINFAIDAASGMTYLHSATPPILHLDLKSPNLLIDDRMRLKVADFGLAMLNSMRPLEETRGTLLWMAPEVIRQLSVDEKADVYSFGIILWELIGRRLPYYYCTKRVCNRAQFARRIAYGNVRPRPLPARLPGPFAMLMTRCWDANPVIRPSFPEICSFLEKMEADEWPEPNIPAFAKGDPTSDFSNDFRALEERSESQMDLPPGNDEIAEELEVSGDDDDFGFDTHIPGMMPRV